MARRDAGQERMQRELQGEEREPITYDGYLNIPTILGCLQPITEVPTEKLFIMIHQVFELWFRQVLDDIDAVRQKLQNHETEKELLTIEKLLQRIVMIFKLVTQQFAIMETMSPMEFMDFRSYLSPASGFQSLQFRLIEINLGVNEDTRLRYADKHYTAALGEEARQKIRDALAKPTLLHLLGIWLENTPGLDDAELQFTTRFREEVQRWKRDSGDNYEESGFESIFDGSVYARDLEAGGRRISQRAFLGGVMTFLYREEPVFAHRYTILSLLMDIEAVVWQWRSNHVMMVHRMIGRKPGTAGSSGVLYLSSTIAGDRYRIFVDLFNITTYLVPGGYIPALPAALKRRLGFVPDE